MKRKKKSKSSNPVKTYNEAEAFRRLGQSALARAMGAHLTEQVFRLRRRNEGKPGSPFRVVLTRDDLGILLAIAYDLGVYGAVIKPIIRRD